VAGTFWAAQRGYGSIYEIASPNATSRVLTCCESTIEVDSLIDLSTAAPMWCCREPCQYGSSASQHSTVSMFDRDIYRVSRRTGDRVPLDAFMH